MVLPALLVLACTTEPPPSGKDLVITGGGGSEEKALDEAGTPQQAPHVENSADLDRFAFTCCTVPAATALVGAYVDLQEALAADDGAKAKTAMKALHTAATAAGDDEKLPDAGRAQAAAIAQGTASLVDADVAAMRAPLASLSVSVITFARDHQGGDDRIVSAWCPMAPGHWLQRGAEIRNPYYGAEMLTCGTLEAVTDVE